MLASPDHVWQVVMPTTVAPDGPRGFCQVKRCGRASKVQGLGILPAKVKRPRFRARVGGSPMFNVASSFCSSKREHHNYTGRREIWLCDPSCAGDDRQELSVALLRKAVASLSMQCGVAACFCAQGA